MSTSSDIIPSTIVASITKSNVTFTVHEISTRHTNAIGIPVTHPYVVVHPVVTSQRWAFATLYEAIDMILGDNARPRPFWSDSDLAELIIDETSDRGTINYTAIVGRIIRSLIGVGQLHVCDHDHILIGEVELRGEEIPCGYCQFEDGELADAIHNARTEVVSQLDADYAAGYDFPSE